MYLFVFVHMDWLGCFLIGGGGGRGGEERVVRREVVSSR